MSDKGRFRIVERPTSDMNQGEPISPWWLLALIVAMAGYVLYFGLRHFLS